MSCNIETLNITAGTDVILNVTLEHDGIVLNPALIDNLQANLVTGLGRKTPLETSTGIDYIVVNIPWVDGRMPGYYSLEITGSINGLAWSTVGKSIIRYTSATEIGRSTVDVDGDHYDVTMEVGYYYTDSPIEGVSATIDDGVGEPSVETSYIRKQLSFDFHNLKGEQGEQGHQGIQGPQGDSVIVGEGDLPLTHVLGEDNTKAMSQKGVTDAICDSIELVLMPLLDGVIDAATGNITSSSAQKIWIAKVAAGDKIVITGTNSDSKAFRYGFTVSKPAIGGTVQNVTAVSGTQIHKEFIVESDGYLYVNHGNTYFEDTTAEIIIKKDTSLSEKWIAYNTIEGKVISWEGGNAVSLTSMNCSDYVDIEGCPYIIYGQLVTMSTTANYGMAFYDVNKQYIIGERIVNGADSYTTNMRKVAVPDNAKYLRFTHWKTDAWINGLFVKAPFKKDVLAEQTIILTLRYESVSSATGEVAPYDYGKKIISTPRYIKTNSDFSILSDIDVRVRVFFFKANYDFIGYTTAYYNISSGTPSTISVTEDTAFVKLSIIRADDYVDFTVIPQISLTGHFPSTWDICNVRPSDDGYKRIAVRVNVTHPNCCDESDGKVQDESEHLVDYGVIALPERYKPVGKPTRLIIYCHGAGVNYADNVTRFDSSQFEPQYWLAEGYAVMDIEGNPFDNENEHMCTPQATDCYEAAYKWAIDHFNLRKDGVFLGGRSMGGANTLNLIAHSNIPIVAACCVACAGPSFGYGVPDRKKFTAIHAGFQIPPSDSEYWDESFVGKTDVSQLTYASNRLPESEAKLLKFNWTKYLKTLPHLNFVADLPDNEEIWEVLFTVSSYSQEWVDFTKYWHAHAKCPIKFLSGYQDTCRLINQMMTNMLTNSGCYCEMRVFDDSGDEYPVGSPHSCEIYNPRFRAATYVTRYGETLTNVPMFYIEMLQFWRRYEQEEL